MSEDLIDFSLRAAIVLFLYGCHLAARQKPLLWQWAVYFGITGNGISAFGYLLPWVIPHADRVGLTTNAILIGVAMISYVRDIPDTSPAERRLVLRELGIGLAFILTIASVRLAVGVQQENNEVTQDLAQELREIRIELRTARVERNALAGRVSVVERVVVDLGKKLGKALDQLRDILRTQASILKNQAKNTSKIQGEIKKNRPTGNYQRLKPPKQWDQVNDLYFEQPDTTLIRLATQHTQPRN